MSVTANNMFHILLLATVSVALATDTVENKAELKPQESASPIRVYQDERRHRFEDGLELMRSRDDQNRLRFDHQRDDRRDGNVIIDFKEEHSGPAILRSPDPIPSHGHPDIERQNKIIADVYSPDYYQPTWILDYRYLKTGGRDYTRGPGGQILILPENVRTNEQKEFPDFDSLLEHLRLSRLSERARYGGSGDDHDARRGYGYNHDSRRGYGDDHDPRRGYLNIDLGQYGRGQNQQRQKPWRNPQH